MAEIHGGAKESFRKHEAVFDVGGRWDLSERFGLLGSVGRSLRANTSDESNLLAYLGLQIRL